MQPQNQLIFNFHSRRARLARVYRLTIGSFRLVLLALSAVFLGFGVWFLASSISFGWFFIGLAVWPILPIIWNVCYLNKLPIDQSSTSIDARLSVKPLSILPENLDRDSLVQILKINKSARFMMYRSGVSPDVISENLTLEQIAISWNEALLLQPDTPIFVVSWSAGIIKTDEQAKSLLHQLQLDVEDVDAIARWYIHLENLSEIYALPKLTGGLARDWTFGYAPTLKRFATNVSERVDPRLAVDFSLHRETLNFMTQTFSKNGPQNVTLVGALGVGKSKIVETFAAMLLDAGSGLSSNLKFRQVFSLDASAIISAASDRGQIEGILNKIFNEVYDAKNIILCLDNAELFFEDGIGSVDLSNLLEPIIVGGAIRTIVNMEEQCFLRLADKNQSLAQNLNKIVIPPSDQSQTMRVIENETMSVEYRHDVVFMYQALREIYTLSERYFHDMSQPGKSLLLLEKSAQYAENGLVTANSVQQSIEKTQGIKVASVTSSEEKQMLLNLEDLIHQRMVNQTRAVKVVSDALRRARTGVRSQNRPIGTFLFIGPTGVGKTELAKALGEAYFGGEDRLIRLDLNEFVTQEDVARLIADGANDPRSLSAQIMKQPFSVVLLDEIEKAHDSVLTTLLQVLDEGILRDEKGREVSFRDSIILATSNAGAEHIRHHIEAGEELEQFEELLVDELVNSGEFRPEFLNRFDEIVLFRPLKPDELCRVVDLIISGINKTLLNQKIAVGIDDGLKNWIVEHGNDPRLGARPMRRMVQRVVENVIAERMLSDEIKPGSVVQLTVDDLPDEMREKYTDVKQKFSGDIYSGEVNVGLPAEM